MLGKKIKEYMDSHGFKQVKVAENADMTPQTLNDILNGRRRLEAMEYFRICKALGVSMEYFTDEEKEEVLQEV